MALEIAGPDCSAPPRAFRPASSPGYVGGVRTLVTGATGYVGSRLVTALLANHYQVAAATRNPARLKRLGCFDDVAPVVLDAADPASARAAFAATGPIDVVYYLVHGIGQPGFRDARHHRARSRPGKRCVARRRPWLRPRRLRPPPSRHPGSRASMSFEMLRYVGDSFPLIPIPAWTDNPIDPISVRDVLHYLVAAADTARVPAGAYDICGPDTTSYRGLLKTYGRISGRWRAGLRVPGVDTGVASWVTAVALPVPEGLAGELVESLTHPMLAAGTRLRVLVADPPGGLLAVDDAIALALSRPAPRPVNALAHPHHLADSDPAWAGGERYASGGLPRGVTPPIARPTLGLVNVVPGPLAGALRTGLDMLITLTPKVRPA